jgi:hypothetical protein
MGRRATVIIPAREGVMMTSRCVNNLGGKVLLMDATPEQVNDCVRKHAKECYEAAPGFVFKNVKLLLKAPILVGLQIRRQKILLPFTKPCPNLGTILYEIAAKEEDLEFLRERLRETPE